MKFQLGKVVMTKRIAEQMTVNSVFEKDIQDALLKYCKCDWGVLCEDDKAVNDYAVKDGGYRIFAAYETSEGNIWIITEADRSATTILWPDEY